jgi:hypothetical protein
MTLGQKSHPFPGMDSRFLEFFAFQDPASGARPAENSKAERLARRLPATTAQLA